MTLTFEQVQAHLEPEEPNYKVAARLGPDAVEHLMAIIDQDDPWLAARAAYLAGLIGDVGAVARAAGSAHGSVRVAAAAVLPRLPQSPADGLVQQLINDPDIGVRKVVARAAATRPTEVTRAALSKMEQDDPESFLRELAGSLGRDIDGIHQVRA